MATFKLGAFVTDISGSIGGTTFKRGTGNRIILNKTRGASRNKLLSNPALQKNTALFRKWALTSAQEKSEWATLALNFLFPDKYGVPKHLTGRQLFNKLSIQLSVAGLTIENPSEISNNIPELFLSNFNISATDYTTELLAFVNPSQGIYLVQLEVSLEILKAPTFTRRQIIFFAFANAGANLNIRQALLTRYPYINAQYAVRAYVTMMNESGFRGPTASIEATWTS